MGKETVSDVAEIEAVCPPSAVSSLVVLSGGLFTLLGMAVVCLCKPFTTQVYNAMVILTFIGVGVLGPDALLRIRAQRLASQERPPAHPSWRRSFIKFAGLAAIFALGLWSYCLLPEYARSYFRPYFVLIKTLSPVWFVLSLPYIYYVDRTMNKPEDGLFHLGSVVLLHKGPVDRAAIRQLLLGWLVKFFFIPLMFCSMYEDTKALTRMDFSKFDNFTMIYGVTEFFLYYMDGAFVTVTYILSLRCVDTHIRSTEPSLLGWLVALVCYQPFNELMSSQYWQYQSKMGWQEWLASFPSLFVVWGSVILILTGIYLWGTLSFGGRFSNLTHRGIITNGAYRYTKHPAYISKNLSWWFLSVPFVAAETGRLCVMHCVGLLLLNGIYYLRAKTEERHLSLDPVYVQYSVWIDRHGLLRWINRVPVLGALARWKLKPFDPRILGGDTISQS